MNSVPPGHEVVEFDPMAEHGPQPVVLWAAPGSLFVEEVARAWARRGSPADLAGIGGPWAVLLWDPATRCHLLAADPVGVQPLFWARTSGGRLGAASWLAQLVDRPDVDQALDFEAILIDQGLDLLGPEVLHRTPFTAVSRVPWGRALRIAADGTTRLEQYWDPEALPGPDESLTPEDCAELLRDRIDTAVRRLTPTEVPVGAHISGGLDCTSVALRAHAHLRAAGGGLVAGYSWAPSESDLLRLPGDERDLLDQLTTTSGIPIRTITADGSGDWFDALDPTRYPASTHFRERWTLPQAAADGVRVLLSGWGGDELASFNGRGVIPELVRTGRLGTARREVEARLQLPTGVRVGASRRARALAGAAMASLPRATAHDLRHPIRARSERARSRELDTALRGFSPLAADLRLADERAFDHTRGPRAIQLALLTRGHLQHRTSWWYQTGRLFGIEYRYPLLDVGVVEAALRLPRWAFLADGWSRAAFRRAVARWVPPEVAWRVGKHEPALFAPGLRDLEVRLRPLADTDPTYERAAYLAELTWQVATGPIREKVPVASRPERTAART